MIFKPIYFLFTAFGSPSTSARDTKKPDTSLENKSSAESISKSDGSSPESIQRVSDEEVKRIASNSKEFLSHLSALNQQFFQWIDQHIKKNPYILISPCIRDYEKHLAELAKEYADKKDEKKDEINSSPESVEKKPTVLTSPEKQPPTKGLLSGIFGNSATTATTTSTEKFSFGSSQPFTFGQEKKSDSSASKDSAATAASGFSFGSTGPTTSGFTFGSATGAGSTFGSR